MRKLRNSELNRLSNQAFKQSKKAPVIVALDDVRSMHNVGSVFRTADAFRVEKLLLGGITPTPPLVEIEKTALGSTASVNWLHEVSLLRLLNEFKGDGYAVIGFEQTDTSKELIHFHSAGDKGKYVLVFGNEVKGISNEVLAVCDEVLEIPQFGTKHSLNISVSVGIAIWEVLRERIKKGAM